MRLNVQETSLLKFLLHAEKCGLLPHLVGTKHSPCCGAYSILGVNEIKWNYMVILTCKMFSEIVCLVGLLLNLQMCQIILPDPVALFWHRPPFVGAVKITYLCITVVAIRLS